MGSSKSKSVVLPLTVTEFGWKVGDYGNRFITGTLINNSGNDYMYVEVEFDLYDESGKKVGNTFTNMNDLLHNGMWNFEAVVVLDEAREAKLKGVVGF